MGLPVDQAPEDCWTRCSCVLSLLPKAGVKSVALSPLRYWALGGNPPWSPAHPWTVELLRSGWPAPLTEHRIQTGQCVESGGTHL